MTDPQQFLIYQSEDGSTRIDVMLDPENIWLNLTSMASVPPPMMKLAMHISLSPALSRKWAREIRSCSASFMFKQLTELSGKAKGAISEHIKRVFDNPCGNCSAFPNSCR